METFKRSSRDLMAGAFFLTVIPLLAHLSFSWMGFCPTYEGLNLAFSRRILDGQVPHRDFINIRPIGSALLYAPFVAFGGDLTFWICRLFVWFELACIAWIWTQMILRTLRISMPPVQQILIAAIAMMFTSHTFPPAAWYTVDGFFFLSIGLVLCLDGTPGKKLAGYAMIGLAYLCKQSFLLIFPGLIVALGDWRRARYWLAAAAPGAAYLAYLFSNHALSDGILQLGSHSDAFFSKGFQSYFKGAQMPAGFLIGFFAARSLFGSVGVPQKMAASAALGGLLVTFAVSLSRPDVMTAPRLSFVLFGTVLGMSVYLISKKKHFLSFARVGVLALLAGWAVSLSLTHTFPIFAAGPLAVLIFAYGLKALGQAADDKKAKKYISIFMILFFSVSLMSFIKTRRNHVYKNQSIGDLSRSLEEVLPGGRFIRVSPKTYRFLADVKKIREMAGKSDLAILQGLPAYWVTADRKNPLCIDWAIREEAMYNQALSDRVMKDLELHRGLVSVLLIKESAAKLKYGLVELPAEALYRQVRSHFTKINETEFFEVYQ